MLERRRIAAYNKRVREIAAAHSVEFGIDTPEARTHQSDWCRRIRREYPLSQYRIQWGETA